MEPKKFNFKDGNELLSSNSGLLLVGALLNKTKLEQRVSEAYLPASPNPKISHGIIIKSMIALLTLGKPNYDDIEQFREDPFFMESLGLTCVPSSPTIRQRLDDAVGVLDRIIKEESLQLLKCVADPTTITFGS